MDYDYFLGNMDYYNTSEIAEINPPQLFTYPASIETIAKVAYSLLLILGLLGNTLSIYTINYTNPRLKTVQNLFLSSLALGDLLITIFCVPIGYFSLISQVWEFGPIGCKILSPIKAVAVFVSSYTLVALAFDRYIAIIYPLKIPPITKQHARWIVAIVWFLAIVTAMPIFFYSTVEGVEFEGEEFERCGEYSWPTTTMELTYSLTLLTLQFIIPVFVLIFTYGKIFLVVYRKESNQATMLRSGKRNKKKTLTLSLTVVLAFVFAWLPYNTIYMLFQHGDFDEERWFPYAFLLCNFLSMTPVVIHPLIYFWINGKFRRALKEVVGKKFGMEIRTERSSTRSNFLQ